MIGCVDWLGSSVCGLLLIARGGFVDMPVYEQQTWLDFILHLVGFGLIWMQTSLTVAFGH
jgi:hypothetical protein